MLRTYSDVQEYEGRLRKSWKDINLLDLSVKNREGRPSFVFYEGPPTANGKPGIHHMLSRALKDGVCRYKTMSGFSVKRKAGWDTHGLPVEITVEKELKLKSKPEIEKYGIDKFNTACRNSVFTYEAYWKELTEKMGYLVDLENPYITLDNNYIETVWYILDYVYKKGLLYEGHKILPYCARCGTGLASHEVAQGYKEIRTNTVIVKFKAKDEDAYFLVWTTTPWTLASNVALAVNPKETYIKAKKDGSIYYVQKDLAKSVLEEDYEVLDEFFGTALEHREYEQIMPFANVEKKAFFVTCADYVTITDGTGIVHIAPAFGEDDYQVGIKYNLPVLNLVSEEGKYIATPWKGENVLDKDLEVKIIIWLSDHNKLFKKQAILHNYPHCWRCDSPLLYYAKKSWFIAMTKLKDELVANNKTVKWYPSFVGDGRFGNWLENVNDWAISRSRYWGTPLNIWRCDCGEITSIGSIQELKERAIKLPDEPLDLHRPYVDNIQIECKKCKGTMQRVKDVIDCWFDSGAMPFAQHHYPFENKDNFNELFPADFICEGIDQTRGWFYSLLAISTLLTGKSPYKNVLVNDLVLDKNGKKMSKSRGNTIDPFDLMDKYGADAVRWYMYYNSPAWEPTKFDEKDVREIGVKFFATLKNIYTFFAMYANADKLDVKEFNIPFEKRSKIDKWLLSKTNKLIREIKECMNVFDLTRSVRKIHNFVSEDFSNWYIRRNRRRFWSSELNEDKEAVYQTTYEVLLVLAKLIAPFAPFASDELYLLLSSNKSSVHLEDFPEFNSNFVEDDNEKQMDLVRDLVSLGRGAREKVKIKVRQPLKSVLIDYSYKKDIEELQDLLVEELNIKEVIFEKDISSFMSYTLKPNFVETGKLLGSKMKLFQNALLELDQIEYAKKLMNGESIEFNLGGTTYHFDKNQIQIVFNAKDGFTVEMKNNLFVILDTTLTDDLIEEGFAREIVSKIQQIRKNLSLDVLDNIVVTYKAKDIVINSVNKFKDYISKEVLATNIVFDNNINCGETFDVNDEDVIISVQKVS